MRLQGGAIVCPRWAHRSGHSQHLGTGLIARDVSCPSKHMRHIGALFSISAEPIAPAVTCFATGGRIANLMGLPKELSSAPQSDIGFGCWLHHRSIKRYHREPYTLVHACRSLQRVR